MIDFDRRGALQATLEQGPFPDLSMDDFYMFFNDHRSVAVFKKKKKSKYYFQDRLSPTG